MRTRGRIPLTSLLSVLVYSSALLSFMMAYALISPVYIVAFGALSLVAALIDARGLPHPPHGLVGIATAAVLVGLFARIRLNYTIEILMEAVLVMTAVKLLENKKARDYAQLTGLSLATVVCTAMLSVEMSFVVYCFGVGLISTFTLIANSWYAADPRAEVSSKEVLQLFLRSLGLFVWMLPVCLLIFFAAPRTHGPFIGWHGRYATAETGFSDQVQLGDVGNIQANKRLVFRAEMPPLSPNMPYWRGMVLDFFDGRAWSPSKYRPDRSPFIPDPNAPKIRQEIFLEPGMNRRYVFALDQPLAITNIDANPLGDGIFLYTGPPVTHRVRYNALSTLSPKMRPTRPGASLKRSLFVPANSFPRLTPLVKQITNGLDEPGKIDAIMAYLAPPNFEYSLEGLPQTADALEQFIFVNRKGNCEYFAAAAGVMLRLAGVPARLVAGYKGGSYNEAGGFYNVTEESAHVWIEAWNSEEEAWVRFDPTPPGAGPDSLGTSGLWGEYFEYLDYQWSKLVINYNWDAQRSMFGKLRELVSNPGASLTPTKRGLVQMGNALTLPLIAVLLLIACGSLLRLFSGRRRPEELLRLRFLRIMNRRGYVKHESEGLEEFLQQVTDPALRCQALDFVRRFEAFYYKDRAADKAALAQMREQLDRLGSDK